MAQIVKLRRSSVSGQKPTNTNLQLGELALNTTDGKVYMAKSGSLGPSVEELVSTNTVNTGSIFLTDNVTASFFTGSFIGDGSGLYNLPVQNINTASLATTGSNIFVGNQTITGSINITGTVDGVDISQFSSSVDARLNSVTASGGISAIYIADEGAIQGTASYFDFIGAGISAAVNNGTASITVTATGGGGSAIQGASQTYTQTTNATTWSIDHSINSRTPVVEVYDQNYNVIIPTGIYNPGAFQTLIYFDVAQRGYAIISTGGGLTVDGANAILDQASASSTWTFNHNLGTKYPVFNIFDSNDDVIIPQRINVVDENTAVIYFSSARSGKAVASVGGDVVNSDSSSFATNANFLDGKDSTEFATTGSNNFKGSQIITGSLNVTQGITGSIDYINLINVPSLVSGSSQILITGTTGYSTFSSSISTSIGGLSSSIATTDLNQNNRISSLETSSGSIRTDFNTFTSSYTTVSGSIDSRLDILEAYSGSQQVPTASYSFRTTQTDVYCKNMSGAQINKGTVVRITGAVGDNPLIGVASLLTEGQSANTLGIATEDIPNDGFGLVITEGVLTGVNTDGMTAGQLLFLGANGTFTTSYPVAPNHGVRLGEVLRVQQQQGSIYVRIDNGSELGEAHDVYDTTTNSSYGDLLVKSGSVWINSKKLNGDYVVTGSLTVTQNLTVLGSSSLVYVTSSQLAVSASTISVNVFEPAERFGGLKVYDSGSSNATASLLWDSLNNHWVYQNASGSNYSGGMLLAGPRNTGSLGDEVGLINGRIPKSVGGDHLDNSIISETGTTITVAGDLVANSITGAFDFFGLVNRPTLVSGSSQIDITGTTNYSTFSSSIATTTLNGENRLNSIEEKTGSYATTGSNVFKGTQTIDGNLFMSGNFRLIYNDDPTTNMLFGQFDGSTIDGPYYQLFGNQYANVSQRGSAEFVYDIRNGGDSGFNIAEFNGSSWIRRFRIGADGALISGSLNLTNELTASLVSSSFKGDGSQLYNIPATGVTGLQLDKIADGSATASISQTNGFVVNTNTIITGSLTATALSGSLDFDYLINIPTLVSGSDQLTGSYDTRYVLSGSITQTTWDNIANKPSDIVSSSSQISAFGFLETSSFNSFTSSYNTGSFTGSFTGSLFGTASYAMFALSASNAPGFTTNMTQSSAAATWSFVHNLNTRNPILQVYDSSYNQIVPNEIVGINESTAEIRFDYSQAGYAVASNGGGLYITGSTSRINQTVNATTWSFTHNLGTKYPSFEVFDGSDNVIIPAGIKATSINTAEIYFATPTSGVAIANFSGVNGFQENSVTSSFALATKWNTIEDNPITGSLTSATAGTTSTILSVSTGSYYGAFFDYVAVSGSNSRAGTVMSTWNGSSIVYNESTTNDIGNTNEVTMSVDLNGENVRLRSTNTNQWSIRSLVRLI
jgi:hypothetical protein